MAMMPPRTPWHSQKKLNWCSLLILVHLFLTQSSLTNLTPRSPLTQSFGYNIEYLCGYLKKFRNYPVNCSKCHFETFSLNKYSSLKIRHTTHPHLGKLSQKKVFFGRLPLQNVEPKPIKAISQPGHLRNHMENLRQEQQFVVRRSPVDWL